MEYICPMRTVIISLMLYIVGGELLFGQASGFSIGISGDYGFGVLRNSFGTSGSIDRTNGLIVGDGTEPYLASLGKGYGLQVDLSKRFKKNMELGLGTNYHTGLPITFHLRETNYAPYGGFKKNTTTTYNSISQVQFYPFFKISSPDSSVKPYIKIGALFGCFGKISQKINTADTSSSNYGPPPYSGTTITYTNTQTNYKGGIALGFSSAIGIELKITSNLLFKTECTFNFMQWKPRKGEEHHSSNYSNSYNTDYTETDNISWAYSSIKPNIGLIYTFKKARK